MPTATLPQNWRGRSGREYVPAEGGRVRHGGMATVRKVVGKGSPVGSSVVEPGVPIALKLWTESDEASLDQLQAEAKVLVEVGSAQGELPCPRLYDLVGSPLVTGIVMEWCPADLERWWREKLKEPDAFGRLMATMAEAARRVSDYHVFFAQKKGLDAAHGDLKPSNILLSQEGRWLISDFGAARVRPPDDNPLVTSKVVAGTENFLAPEALFHARKRFPAAMDTWSLAASLFALLRMQRMVLDNAQVPRNGTQSPRFRMGRINQIHEVYGRDPTRFHERDLDAEAFPEPMRLPEEDRVAVREAMRGVFGEPDAKREEQLSRELLEVLDRAMSIEPKYRYTDARDLAAAFERLTRIYIELSAARDGSAVDTAAFVRERDSAEDRAKTFREEAEDLRQQVQSLEKRLEQAEKHGFGPDIDSEAPTRALKVPPDLFGKPEPITKTVHVPPPRWWGFALLVLLLFQGLTLVLLVAFAAVVMWRMPPL